MAKRKRGGGADRSASAGQNSAYDDAPRSTLAINNYMDVADEQDVFHSNRDKVLLEDAPEMKRWRGVKDDDMLELSDEEVLAGADSDSDEDEDGEEEEEIYSGGEQDGADVDSEDVDATNGVEEDEDDPSGWGTAKADYYGADEAQNDEEILREEQAAREAQQKRLKGLTDADYGFDEGDWIGSGPGSEPKIDGLRKGVVSEQLPELEVRDDMSNEEKIELLKTRYPEFEVLSQELLEGSEAFEALAPALDGASREAKDGKHNLQEIKAQALSAYLSSLVMYFAILTSTAAEEGTKKTLPMAPSELREHPIMDTIFRCRQNWINVKDLEAMDETTSDSMDEISGMAVDALDVPRTADERQVKPKSSKSKKDKRNRKADIQDGQNDPRFAASEARRQARLKQTEESLARLTQTLDQQAPKTTAKPAKSTTHAPDYDSDIGDEDPLDDEAAADKARKRKSLRFYTSQIQQKANKRANASRAAGGDDDIPYRERLKDKQARLLREAEKRGQRSGKDDADLGGDSDDNGAGETNVDRERRAADDSDGAGQTLEDQARAKKAGKQAREDAYQQAKAEGGQVVRFEEAGVGADGRRNIGYTIEKNKGLAANRKKQLRNPRVKKRKKYEDKTKKLRSMKPVFKGGEGRGGYGGELTGIKKGVVKSVKL